MKDKAYIVANKEQELDVLNKLEQDGFVWTDNEKPTSWVPSDKMFVMQYVGFPYVLSSSEDGNIIWIGINSLENETIVYDGRKEDKMYKVTQEFMDELIKWRDEYTKSVFGVNAVSLTNMPEIVRNWRFGYNSSIETNKRFGAIIDWINGEDVFEVEATHKFVVRSEIYNADGDYVYVFGEYAVTDTVYSLNDATKFDTREEAQEWANSHQVVVEIDEDGNEVE